MSILNKIALVMSILLVAQISQAGSLTITTKDKDGRTKTIVQESYDTPVYTRPPDTPTRYQRPQPPSKPVVTDKQDDAELAQMAAQEENRLRNRIADYKRLEADRILNTTGGIMIYDVHGPKIRALERRLKELQANPRVYFRYKSKHDDLEISLDYRPSTYEWPYPYAPPAYTVITKGAGPSYYKNGNSDSNLSLGIVLPPKRFFGSPRHYKRENDPNVIIYDGSHD